MIIIVYFDSRNRSETNLSLYFLPCDLTAGHFCHIVTLWLFFKHTWKTFFEDKIVFVKPITYWCCLFSWNLRAISLQSLFLYVYHPFIAFLHFLQIFISTKFNFLTKTRFYVLLLTDSSANTPASSAENLRLVFPSLEKLASHAHVCPCVCVQQLLFNTKHSYSCVISWQRFTWLPSQKRQVI